MKYLSAAAACLLATLSLSAGNTGDLILKYDRPAGRWTEAIPVGNGRLGAMVSGGVRTEHLQLNECTLYSGEPSLSYPGADVSGEIKEVSAMIAEGRTAEAEDILMKRWMGVLHQYYEPMSDLWLDFEGEEEAAGYLRELDLEKSITRISYTAGGARYVRELIASNPDDVIVMRLTCDRRASLSFTARFTSKHPTATWNADGTTLAMKGQAPGYIQRRTFKELEEWGTTSRHPILYDSLGRRKTDRNVFYGDEIGGLGMYFDSRIRIVAKGGEVKPCAEGIRVAGADEVLVVISAATSFNGYDKSPSKEGIDASAKAGRLADAAAGKSWKALVKAHVRDYRALADRVSLVLAGIPGNRDKMTDERIASYAGDGDPALAALLFHFGRYLMISGSRPGGQPMNLQGIWNDDVIPAWNSGYTININTEMNYWPAEPMNLSECAQPLFDMIGEMAVTGRRTASAMYGLGGWVAHHNVSIWRETTPNDGQVRAAYWPMSSGWLCRHLWEHYLSTGDEAFLRDRAYPLMKGAAEFYTGWLVEDGEGHLVTPVSTSPENRYFNAARKTCQVDRGSTMDMSIIRDLFRNVVEASAVLGVDAPFAEHLSALLPRLLPFQVGSKGQLQEWSKDYGDVEPHHRHISHLYGFYPGNQINWVETPDLCEAVRRTMEMRGDVSTGWAMGWKINVWARMLDGDHALKIIGNLIRPVTFEGMRVTGGGLYNNMFDAHPPFQIDGNFGYTSGVAEMLVQSHMGFVHLLPALPSAWKEGSFSGIVARGGFECAVGWSDGSLDRAEILSKLGKPLEIVCATPFKVSCGLGKTVASQKFEMAGRTWYKASFDTSKGKVYKIKPSARLLTAEN